MTSSGPDQFTVLLGGAIAGFTIFLGLPLAFLRGSTRLRAFLNSFSVGILLFLFVEIAYRVIESVESTLKLLLMGYRAGGDLVAVVVIFVLGFAGAVVGLVLFETRFFKRGAAGPKTSALHVASGPPQRQPGKFPPDPELSNRRRMALMIAVGIGLHNFSEGLVIGQQFAGGAISLGFLLVVGFALHNATEGFGIVGPLAGTPVSVLFLGLLGLIGGGPTFLGTVLGMRWTSEPVEILFLSLAAGAILYIVGELFHHGRRRGTPLLTTSGLLVGFFLAFGSDLVIEKATTEKMMVEAEGVELKMAVGDYFFDPSEIRLKAGRTARLVLANHGEVEHEIEILGLGEEMEEVIPWQGRTALLVSPRFPGRYPFLCDIPGHLAKGMRGVLVVEP